MSFAEKLKSLRKQLGLSREKLASLVRLAGCEIYEHNILQWENGTEPRLSVGLKLDEVIRAEATRQNASLDCSLVEREPQAV